MISFVSYSSSTASYNDQQEIINIFNQLLYQHSYYYNLQVLYNSHHTELCTMENIYNIAQAAINPYDNITVQGTVHTNSHSSKLLISSETGKSLFVKDTYIRVVYRGSIYHILTLPPTINTYNYVYYPNNGCDNYNLVIEPIISII